MRRRLSLLPLAALLALAPEFTPDAAASEQDETVHRALVQVNLKAGGKLMKHPGHVLEVGEEVILTFQQGKTEHEVSVAFEQNGKQFVTKVAYERGGKTILSGSTKTKAKAWGKVVSRDGKTRVEVRVNPEAKRPDEVELPGGKDPLDGV